MDGSREEVKRNYAGAFDGRLGFGRSPALIVVDMVEAYLQPGSPLFLGETGHAALASAARLAEVARAVGSPVILTNVVYAPGGVDGGLFYRKVPALSVFQKGSPLGDFPAALYLEKGDVLVSKQYASAFFGTSLASTLTSLGVDTVLIAGFSTSGCVRATALDALQHGFAPFVVADACADRHAAPHEANLFDLQAKYAEVVDEQAALTCLSALKN